MASEPPVETPIEPAPPPAAPPAPPPAAASGMVARIKAILLEPRNEWARIDAEPASVGGLMAGWVAPLAAIGPAALLIGSLVFGFSFLGVTYRPSITEAVSQAVFGYVMALISAFALALIIDALAPSFGGTRNRAQAMKVAAYGGTAAYLAGIFQIMPGLGLLGLLGLYSLYLLYLGLPRLMRAPEDKAMAYTAVTILVAAVLFIVAGSVAAATSRAFFPRTFLPDGSLSGSVALPGGGAVDLGKMGDVAKRIEARGSQPAVPAATLAAMLPASVGGWNRTAIESSSGAAAGIGASHAEARYGSGGKEFRLSITDTNALGAVGALGAALGVESSRQDASGYEKTATIDGRITTERWNNSGSGKYGVLFGNRFMVEAEGDAPDIATLKSAVAAVDSARLEAMAK